MPGMVMADTRRPKLQILNGSAQTVDVFWLRSDAERVPNGTIEPGKETSITTTIGHRFAVVGRDDKAESVITSEVPVQAFRVGDPGQAPVRGDQRMR